jgi:hypothetical protein
LARLGLLVTPKQLKGFFEVMGADDENVLLRVDAVRTLKSGAAEPSVEKLLRSFKLPGVSMDFSN